MRVMNERQGEKVMRGENVTLNNMTEPVRASLRRATENTVAAHTLHSQAHKSDCFRFNGFVVVVVVVCILAPKCECLYVSEGSAEGDVLHVSSDSH